MQKLLFSLAALLCLSACKKQYTCECKTTYTGKLNNGSYVTSSMEGTKTPYSEKMTKKRATAACQHEESVTETNFTNAVTANGRYPLVAGESIDTSCSLN